MNKVSTLAIAVIAIAVIIGLVRLVAANIGYLFLVAIVLAGGYWVYRLVRKGGDND